MTTMTTAAFTAARVQGRYRVLDEAGQIVVTLNSKAKAEARATELNEQRAADVAAVLADGATPAEAVEAAELDRLRDAELLARVEADVAMEQAMDAECPQEEDVLPPIGVTVITPSGAQATGIAVPAAQEPQDAPQEDAGTKDAPEADSAPQSAAQPVAEKPAKGKTKGKTAGHTHQGQPEPHAFTTVGTKIPNHCAECGRTWAAAAHRKFREAQTETVEEVTAGTAEETEGEWTPAADDTTEDGKAPGETGVDAS